VIRSPISEILRPLFRVSGDSIRLRIVQTNYELLGRAYREEAYLIQVKGAKNEPGGCNGS
jgi:hypothetical protein